LRITAGRRRLPARRSRAATLLAMIAAGAASASCSNSEESAALGTQQWGPYEVTVETRPSPPRAGQNEVVVIVAGEHHRPVYDALITLRAQASAPWIQAIEDGHVGVYRRAVNFGHGGDGKLQVQLRQPGVDMGILRRLLCRVAQLDHRRLEITLFRKGLGAVEIGLG